jgi:hypothetical protein
MRANVARWVLTSGVRLFLQFWHAKTAVFRFPRGWVPWYVEWTLAFPRAPSGGVSVNVWGAACAAVLTLLGDLLAFLVAVVRGQAPARKQPTKVAAAAAAGSKKEL